MEAVKNLKVAIITPYYGEEEKILLKCRSSVRGQSYPVTHFLVADGSPQHIQIDSRTIHLNLPFNTCNNGATPRGIGALIAFNMGFDVVAFLDADNWYDPVHIQKAVEKIQADNLDIVYARRKIIFPDGEILEQEDPGDIKNEHVDTNCYVITKRAAKLINIQLMWPKEFGAGEDRAMWAMSKSLNLRTAKLDTQTVWYVSNWSVHYKLAAKKPAAPLRKPVRKIVLNYESTRFTQLTGMKIRAARGKNAIDPPEGLSKSPKTGVVIVLKDDSEGRQNLDELENAPFDGVYIILAHSPIKVAEGRKDMRIFYIPDHESFYLTARTIGAALSFQLGCELTVFIESLSAIQVSIMNQVPSVFPKMKADLVAYREVLAEERVAGKELIFIPQTCAYLGLLWNDLPKTNLQGDCHKEYYSAVKKVGGKIAFLKRF